jgi:hypothetical protein
MIDLDFAMEGVEPARHSITPLLLFKLRLVNRTPETAVEHIALTVQVRIEAARRAYAAAERERLVELFGAAADWDRSLRGMLWTTVGVPVPGFAEDCAVELPVSCSCDFEIAASKFLYGIRDGEIPLLLLFSGPVFFRDAGGDLQIGQIAHHKEATYRLPAGLWHSLMAQHYPDKIWLRVEQGLFDELYRYKRERGFASFDQALGALLAAASAEALR